MDLGRVVGPELTGVLQGSDPTEQPLVGRAVGIGGEQIGPDPDVRTVADGDVRAQAGFLAVLADRESLGRREDADATLLARRRDRDGFEVVIVVGLRRSR